jgi:N-acetylglucosaminyldiphosphoundecaprenol N-acetyl-beta-D-mannosaminyltransferase
METIVLAGVRINNITLNETIAHIEKLISRKERAWIVTPNAAHIVLLQSDVEFKQLYDEANLVLPDGMPLVWVSRCLGKPLIEKVSGSDLLPETCKVSAMKGYRVFFLGGNPGVADKAKNVLMQRYKCLKIVGTYSPPFGFDNDSKENAKIISMINEARPDILFVGLGTPKQEKWIYKNRNLYSPCVSIGIGASFDFVAGTVKRAPVWMQKYCLEWFWRFIHEPRRLWRRYLIYNTLFLKLALKDYFKR